MFKKEIIAAVTLAATHAIKLEFVSDLISYHDEGQLNTDNMVTVSGATGTDPGTGLAQTQDVSGLLNGVTHYTDTDAATDDFLGGGLAQIQDEAD